MPDVMADAIRRVLDGDRDAFAMLVDEHQRMLTSFAAFRVPDRSIVDEVVQQTFIRAYEQLEDFRIGDDFAVWLRVICGYMIRTEMTRRHREFKSSAEHRERIRARLLERSLACAPVPPEGDLNSALAACIEGLPEKQAALVRQRYAEEMSVRDLAESLGKTVNWTTTTLYRIRASLRGCIERRLFAGRA